MTFTLYMVRHGQTILNSYNRLQGWCDSPLTAKGVNDAINAGKHLADIKFDQAFHSDTTRATRTCHTILENNRFAEGLDAKELPNFREQGFGYFEGNDAAQTWIMAGALHGCRTYNEILDKYNLGKTRDLLHEADPFKDAEDDKTYWSRINEGFDKLREMANDGENILLVSHSITIRSIVDHFAPELGAGKLGPKNGAVTKFTVSDDDVKVEYYNHYLDSEEY